MEDTKNPAEVIRDLDKWIKELKSEIQEYKKACKIMLKDRDKKVIENRTYKEAIKKIKSESFKMLKKGWTSEWEYNMPDKAGIIIAVHDIACKVLEKK